MPVYRERRYYKKVCTCGCCNRDYAPRRRGGNAITFGKNIRAIATYLSVVQCMPYERLQSLFATMFNVSISQGTLANIVREMLDKSRPAIKLIEQLIKESSVVGFDESGCYVNGKLNWSWISPVGSSIEIVTSHGTAFRSCILTYLFRLGINTEYNLGTINGNSYILANFLTKAAHQFTPGIELPSTDKIWEILLAFMLQTMKKEILAIEAEGLGDYAKSNDFKVRELGNSTTSGYVSIFIPTISGKFLADAENSYEICYKVAHMQCDST